ncbi:hypothetical protein [Kitasatospora sp. NPDC004289]
MSAEVAELVGQIGPYVGAAVTAYGAGVLTRAQDAAVDGTANVGRRIVQAVWQRRRRADRAALEVAVEDLAADGAGPEAAEELRLQIERALREDEQLRAEIAALLPVGAPVVITATGERGIAAQRIGTVISTGDHARFQL